MSYDAAIEGLYSLVGELYSGPGQPRRKFELDEMRVLAAALGHPEQKFWAVLVAGTNGKGSTSATLASILQTVGYRTGLYTSPHLERVNERIRIDGEEISNDDFARFYFQIDDCARQLVSEEKLKNHPSFFEVMTALGFLAFAENQIDIAVLEVGMGGRLDATNIVDPLVSVITDISLDHTQWLGETIAAIAREKAGILRKNGILVTLPQHPEANQTIGEVAMGLLVRGVSAAQYVPDYDATAGRSYPLTLLGERIEIASPLAGVHQQRNVALAIATAIELRNSYSYNINATQIAEGIRKTRWPGRLERFRQEGRADVLLDVAHNPAGVWALRSALSNLSPQPNGMTVVFGCLKDKAFGEMTQILFPLFDKALLTEIVSPRSASLTELQAVAEATGAASESFANSADALERAWEITAVDGLVVVTGSVYLVGELRARLGEDRR